MKRGKRSQQNGVRPYPSEQTVDHRAIFNKDRELLVDPVKVGDMVLSKEQLCELTDIGDGLCGNEEPLKFGKVAGNDSFVEKEFILGPRKFEEYKGSRFYNGDCTVVVDV